MKALITGCFGQDGSYLAEHLLSLNYEVFGLVRFSPVHKHVNYIEGVRYLYGDMKDSLSIATAIRKADPDEIYNLAGQVFVPSSWNYPAETFDINVGGLARILDCLEKMGIEDTVKVYQASSSEMFGNVIFKPRSLGISTLLMETPHSLNEEVPMHPFSPYAVSKYAAHKLAHAYRLRGFYVVSGILFNHESPRRGSEMLTRKVTKHIALWMNGDTHVLRLGSRDSKRDWGFAGDYVKAMHLMMQQTESNDYVIGTGEGHSVEEFVTLAIKIAGLDAERVVLYDCPEFSRPNELMTLVADYSKAKEKLGWKPEHSFEDLVTMMVESDLGLNMKLFGEKHVQRA